MSKTKKVLIGLICIMLICSMMLAEPLTAVAISAIVPLGSKTQTEEDTSGLPAWFTTSRPPENQLKIYFFELTPTLGDRTTGDSCIICIGDVEILVDAGAAQYSAEPIVKRMERVISEDKKWDYIIATHSDADHIAAFTGDKGVFSKFKQTEADLKDDTKWTLGTLIDFDITKDETVDIEGKETLFTKNPTVNVEADGEDYSENLYDKYAKARDAVTSTSKKADKEKGNYFTASQCCWADRGLSGAPKEGAKSEFALGNGATLHILYNYYYDHAYSKSEFTAADKNLLSVCFLIELKDADGKRQTFLFTGDLPEFDSSSKQNATGSNDDYSKRTNGEKKLIEHGRNKDLLEGGVTFYKVAHHGSRTSSSREFIDFIRPQYVVICAVAGTLRHSKDVERVFPATSVLDRLFQYTDHIYITELAVNHGENTVDAVPYYGDIMLTANGEGITVKTSNENQENQEGKEEPKLIQYTDWYKQYRTATLSVYVLEDTAVNGIARCVLLKYGHTDILVDCGVTSRDTAGTESMCFVDKIKQYCVDGVLEYVILTTPKTASLSQMIGQYADGNSKGNGIMDQFVIKNLIDYGNAPGDAPMGGWRANYEEKREALRATGQIKKYLPRGDGETEFEISEDLKDLKLQLFNTSQKSNSLCAMVTFYDQKLLFIGGGNNENSEKALLAEAGDSLSDVTFYLTGENVGEDTNSEEFLEKVHALYTVITTPADYVNANGRQMTDFATFQRLVAFAYAKEEIDGNDQKTRPKRVYLTSQMENGKKTNVCGSITFSIQVRNEKVQRTSLKGENGTTLLHLTNWYKTKLKDKK